MRGNERSTDPDVGFGLVEVMVAMSLLMIIAVAMLPVFINTLKLSKDTVSITTATQLVSEQMDLARANIPPTCDAVHTFEAQTLERTIEDPSQEILITSVEVPVDCPTSYPSAFKLTVTVTEQSSGRIIAQAETRLVLKSKS